MSIVATIGPQNEPLDEGLAQREVLSMLKERDVLKNGPTTRAAAGSDDVGGTVVALEGGGAHGARPTVLSFFRTLKEQQKCEQTQGVDREAGAGVAGKGEARREGRVGEVRRAVERDPGGIEEEARPAARTYADV